MMKIKISVVIGVATNLWRMSPRIKDNVSRETIVANLFKMSNLSALNFKQYINI
jgi:hypothetical protein